MHQTLVQATSLSMMALFLLLLSSCGLDEPYPQEFDLEQRSSINLIGTQVWLNIGDIERGRRVEDVAITTDTETLASDDSMSEGHWLEFTHKGHSYRLTVLRLIDKSPTFGNPFPDDIGVFELDRL